MGDPKGKKESFQILLRLYDEGLKELLLRMEKILIIIRSQKRDQSINS